ncbi:MAG: acyl-CoA dehydrogenase [Rhodospirillaceae bacterium]|jgi:alkylation response protein AidB-like acyl-CoA dehydrogenase|nr:acyl-CoA dehydrogenase [Rhodospirillaceae bacterium]MBT7955687.1 acyl-CoA dehydrogenase [Rhodospirillaceae bacterium]
MAKDDQRARFLAEAKRLAPIFRERALEAEKLRRLPDQSVADIVAVGLQRICQPKRFGGAELPWDALVEVSMELAKGCGSQAWVANVFAEHACHLGHFPDEAQHEVWDDDPETLISTSYAPSGTAERVEGGYKLSGRWGFSSGVNHASWIMLGVFIDNKKGAHPDHHLMLLPIAEVKILDSWETLGLAGTGSNDVEASEIIVPDHRVLDVSKILEQHSPGAEVNTAALFKMPHLGFAQPALAGVTVGMAAGAVADFEAMLMSRKVRGKPLAELTNLQLRLAEASAEVEAARLLALSTATDNMSIVSSGTMLSVADLARSRRNAAYAVKLAKSAVQRVFEATGGHGIYVSQPIQRAFRDVQAAASHIALGWDFSGIIYGRHTLGLDMSDVL